MKNRQEAIESCANPLIAQWINDLYMEAADKESRLMFTYKRALESTIACKEIIKSGRDAMKLPGIGEYIAGRVDRKITDHIKKGGEWHAVEEIERVETTKVVSKTTNPRKALGSSSYTPAFRSAPFAILLTLFEEGGILSRDALKEKGQKYCGSSIEPSVQSAITTLTNKGLIEKFGNSLDLTSEGRNLAKKLYRTINQQNSQEASENDEEEINEEENSQRGEIEMTTWPIGTFDVELLMDLREVKSRDKREYFLDKLSEIGIRCSQRALPLGDFLWIAKKKTRGSNDEAVLDTIIERKTDSDFCSSIPDGRFKEQKHRLGRCGLGKVIYLLEDHGASAKVQSIGEEKVFAALTQTQVVDKFFLRITHSLEETVAFLCKLHHGICKRFQNRVLSVITSNRPLPYNEFQEKVANEGVNFDGLGMNLFSWINSKSGNLVLRDIFVKQLMTIKGVSREKAVKLAIKYDTLNRMIGELSQEKGLKELADFLVGQRKIGNVLARRLQDLVRLEEYPS